MTGLDKSRAAASLPPSPEPQRRIPTPEPRAIVDAAARCPNAPICTLAGMARSRYAERMKLLLENLPESLGDQADTLAQCLEAFARVRPIHHVYLFGSHARGDAGPDSDVDLCIVADGAERQLETAAALRRSLRAPKACVPPCGKIG